MRNGTRTKTVITEIGPVETEVPRDREGSFEPQPVRKRQRRLDVIDEIVRSLAARGLTIGEVAAHFADVSDPRSTQRCAHADPRVGAEVGFCRGSEKIPRRQWDGSYVPLSSPLSPGSEGLMWRCHSGNRSDLRSVGTSRGRVPGSRSILSFVVCLRREWWCRSRTSVCIAR